MVLKLEYEVISVRIYELMNLAKEVKKEIENMENTIEDLGIFWESMAQAEYVMRITAELYNSKAFLEKVKQSIKTLSDTVKKIDEAECSIGEIIKTM